MADETTRLIMEIVGRDRGGRKALTDVAKAADDASDAAKDLDKASDKAGKSLLDTAKDADKLADEIEQTEKSIKELAKEIKKDPGQTGLFKQLNAEQAKLRRLNRVKDLLPDDKDGEKAGISVLAGFRKRIGGFQLGAVARKGISNLASAAGGAALAAGAAIGGLIVTAIGSAMEKSKADSLLRAQLGRMVPAAGDVGRLSGQIYSDNFGDSIQDVNTALKNVIRQGLVDARTASAGEIKQITKQVLTVAQVTEETTDRVAAAASQLVRTGLARNITEALDLITAASQQGLDKAGDLLDTLNEYGTQFRKLGLSGPEALGLISQALQAGARDSDKAADALKEFSIRAIDGSKTTIDAFRSLGLNADEMRERFARGGLAARQALDEVLDRLRNIRNPAERARIQVELFGTQAEDLGAALDAMDLDTAARQMDGFADATKRATEEMSKGSGAETSAVWRKTWSEITQFSLRGSDEAVKHAKSIWRAIAGGDGDKEKAEQATKSFGEQNSFINKGLREAQRAAAGFQESLRGQTADMKSAAAAAGGLAAALDNLTGANVDALRAESDFEAAIDAASAAIDKKVKKLDLGDERGRAYNEQLLNIRDSAVRLAEATFNQTGSQEKANAVIQRGRDQLIKTARQMGLSKEEARRYADQILHIPKSWTTTVKVDNKQALKAISTVRQAIRNVKGKTVGIHVIGPGGSGTQIAGASEGGPILGPGPKGVDSQLRLLAPGEHVLSAEDVDAMGGQDAVARFRKALHSPANSVVQRFTGAGTTTRGGVTTGGVLEIRVTGSGAAWFHQLVRTKQIQLVAGGKPVTVGVAGS